MSYFEMKVFVPKLSNGYVGVGAERIEKRDRKHRLTQGRVALFVLVLR